jgi:hypothetical protein
MKAVQVFATYFGNRRHFPYNQEGVEALIEKQIEHLKQIDLGHPTDLLIVNHDINLEGVCDFLNKFEGVGLRNGAVRILHRPFFEADLSYASYKYAFHHYNTEYDYWFFNEDDIQIECPSLIKRMIDMLDEDPSLGYIAAYDYSHRGVHRFHYDNQGYIVGTGGHKPHAHGGCGLTSTNIMSDVISKFPEFMMTANIRHETLNTYVEQRPPGGYIEGPAEIDFTYKFIEAGYKMKCISDGHSFVRLQDNLTL